MNSRKLNFTKFAALARAGAPQPAMGYACRVSTQRPITAPDEERTNPETYFAVHVPGDPAVPNPVFTYNA